MNQMDLDDFIDQNAILDNIILEQNQNSTNNKQSNSNDKNDFRRLKSQNLKIKNSLLNEIQNESLLLEKYFFKKLNDFPKIFEGNNFASYQEAFDYLKYKAIPTKCECAGIIDNIPGWRCIDCSKYENTIYCSKCYINSKEIHKNHKVEFSNESSGMCDCGDPDSLYNFCPEHCGPFTEQKQIDDYINQVFPENILNNLKIFLDDMFYHLTKYLLLTEKCKLFYNKIMNKKDQKEDSISNIISVKENFAIIFKNFLNFFRKISEKNVAMLHILSSYFLKNNLGKLMSNEKEKAQGLTTHSCIKINSDNIEILYKDKNSNKNILSPMNFTGVEKHKCECPFVRLFVSNYRNNIKSSDLDESEDEKFLLSFIHNLFLKKSMCIVLFFLYKEIIFNNSDYIRNVRSQYFSEDALAIIAQKTTLIEDSFEFLYDYLQTFFEKNFKKYELGVVDTKELEEIVDEIKIYMFDSKVWTKPNIIKLIFPKICISKKLIDIFCLFHNQLIFKSIVPHPVFQSKKPIIDLIDMELFLLFTANMLFLQTDWKNIDKIKEIFNYFFDNILMLHKNKTLGKNEFSYHLPIYRYFGGFLNSFCFNYAINHNTNINDALEYVKKNLFRSKKEMNNLILIILEEYYKYYGFIMGIKTGYFNYYEVESYYFIYFNDLRYLLKDIYLLKYLFAMIEEPIKLINILEKSDLENIFYIFKSIFIPETMTTSQKKESSNQNSYLSSVFNFLRHPIITITNYYYNRGKIDENEYKFAFQWKRLLEMIIIILKNDTTPLSQIFRFYYQVLSSKTKILFYDKIRKNKYLMKDCKNMLKETLIQTFIEKGNLIDLEEIKKYLEGFYLDFFGKKEFDEILNEIAEYKINGEKKQYYIKDSALKFLDFNYYYSPFKRTSAEKYITEFKKDTFKMNNSYYYNPSEFFFDFYNKTYEKILLCIENIELLTTMLEVLLNPIYEERMAKYNPSSIRTILLPLVFNYLSIFGAINSKSFYDFKIKNENLIEKICNILNEFINTNKESKFLDAELAENIMELIKKLNSYKNIKRYINDGVIKFNEKSYNTDEEELNINDEKNGNLEKKLSEIGLKQSENKTKIKNMKDKLKNLMKKKSGKFMDNALKNKNLKSFMETTDITEEESKNEDTDKITCFYCRLPIDLKNFITPYGKLGLIIEDFFYDNCEIASVNSFFEELIQSEKLNNLKKQSIQTYINKVNNRTKVNFYRITSCGHYFHK